MAETPDAYRTAAERIGQALARGDTALDLSGIGLASVPESIGQLSQLQSLDVGGNRLGALPESIGQLSQLQSLDVSNNSLGALPESIGQLTQLQSLLAWGNKLTALPEWIGQLTQLQSLDVSNNSLGALPESIGQLSQLQSLIAGGNRLKALPTSVRRLSALVRLSIAANHLRRIPTSVVRLGGLSFLLVGGNPLVELPASIGQLTNLAVLDLSVDEVLLDLRFDGRDVRIGGAPRAAARHTLRALPAAMRKLTSLRSLFLHGQDALGIPPELLGPTVAEAWPNAMVWRLQPTTAKFAPDERQMALQRSPSAARPVTPAEILEYYFRTRVARRPLNEAKLILVGFGAVGKTSLVNTLVHGKFDAHEAKTEGIRITEWPVQLRPDEAVRLRIWDFGGQEIMHSTHQFFLTQRSMYLLVLSGRQGHEDSDAEYWLSQIRSFGGESPVLVVLNKMKEHFFDVNRGNLRQKYPTIRGFIETDCDPETGIDELRQAILRETDRLEHLRDMFPASWFAIKDRLTGMKENYLTFDRYRALCAEHGENAAEAQNLLAVYLHSLGIALNYKDDPRLRDMHVLNPQWVTNGVYRILNSTQVAERKGELCLADLSSMLDPSEYPEERQSFLLELMRKFELCFRLSEEEDRYLIPELLGLQQPDEAEQFTPDECLNFGYKYPVVPEGLIPRFIARTQVLSKGLPRWRTGVVLEFEGNRALVKLDKAERRVFVSVAGPVGGRQRLMAVIRADFEHVHSNFHVGPEELVPIPGHPEVDVSYDDLRIMEKDGLSTYHRVVDRQVVTLNVRELLNGVDLGGTRRISQMAGATVRPARVFYSYSHKDEALRDELETYLKLLQHRGLIEMWHDRRIAAGKEWEGQIDQELERADIILLLVSADFLASDYINDRELKRAMQRHEAGKAVVVPVIVRDVSWKRAPFGKLEALPTDGKAVTTWTNKDSAWKSVSEGIERLVE